MLFKIPLHIQGHSALSMLLETLSSNQQLELREKHRVIIELLRKRGKPEDAIKMSVNKGNLQKSKRPAFEVAAIESK